MIIYNVTTKLDHTIADSWLEWLKKEHIPDIMKTGCFTHATILQVLETGDTDGITYAVQYHAENKTLYDQYIEKHASDMRKKATEKWGNRFIAFRSLMQVVN